MLIDLCYLSPLSCVCSHLCSGIIFESSRMDVRKKRKSTASRKRKRSERKILRKTETTTKKSITWRTCGGDGVYYYFIENVIGIFWDKPTVRILLNTLDASIYAKICMCIYFFYYFCYKSIKISLSWPPKDA